MLEEAMVLGGEDGLDQHARRVGEADRVILLTGSGRRAREDLRFEDDAAERLALAHDLSDAVALEFEAYAGWAPLAIVVDPSEVQSQASASRRNCPGAVTGARTSAYLRRRRVPARSIVRTLTPGTSC